MRTHIFPQYVRPGFLLAVTIVAVILSVAADCGRPSRYISASGCVWATSYHITYRSDVILDDSIQKVFRAVEQSLSPFSESSLISRINRNETDRVDSLFINVFTTSLMVNRLSGGLFDPTVSPLVNLWGFGYKKSARIPDTEEIAARLPLVGISRCRILSDSLLVKGAECMEFDFSAITKGYGCDLVADMLKRNGVTDYMVEIGGEIALGGKNPYGEPWRITIDAPVENDSVALHNRVALISLTDCGLATSGNYRNYRDTEKGRVGHTINPLTGFPAIASPILSASVIAETTMLADALATACMAMTPDSAMAMISEIPGVKAFLVVRSPDGWKTIATEGFPEIEKGISR